MASTKHGSDFRKILPRPGIVASASATLPALQLPRIPVKSACQECRRSKVKCDGVRPSCYRCSKRHRECRYETLPSETQFTSLKRKYASLQNQGEELQSANTTMTALVDALRMRSPEDAMAILQRIRDGKSIELILQQIETGDLLMELHVAPESKYHYSFPRQKSIPLFLQKYNLPYLASKLYNALSGNESDDRAAAVQSTVELPQYSMPYHTAELVEPRIENINFTQWTTVTDDKKVLRNLIRSYFLYEYPWYAPFQKDYFLDDMVSGSYEFCSSLLVNTVLALACHCYDPLPNRAEHWNPQTLGYRFFAESKRLWDLASLEPGCLTTLQADIIFNVLYNMYSLDIIGAHHVVHATSIANELKLYATEGSNSDARLKRGYDFTAWSLFWWTSLQCYHFLQPPLIENIPELDLPDACQHPQWYGEFQLQYPLNHILQPMYHPDFFVVKVGIAKILHRIATRYFNASSESQPEDGSQRQTFATDIETSLKSWYTSLPRCLQPEYIVFPSQLKIHLLYHNVKMNFHETFLSKEDKPQIQSPDMEYHFSASRYARACFELIIRLYYAGHGFAYSDTYLTHTLTVMAFNAIQDINNQNSNQDQRTETEISSLENARKALLLASKGLDDQSQLYYISFSLLQVVCTDMEPSDATFVGTFTHRRNDRESVFIAQKRYVKAAYPVKLINMADHPYVQRLGNRVTG